MRAQSALCPGFIEGCRFIYKARSSQECSQDVSFHHYDYSNYQLSILYLITPLMMLKRMLWSNVVGSAVRSRGELIVMHKQNPFFASMFRPIPDAQTKLASSCMLLSVEWADIVQTRVHSGQLEANNSGRFARTARADAPASPHVLPGEKTVFLRHSYINMMILPRQARGKHRENSKKDGFVAVPGQREEPRVCASARTALHCTAAQRRRGANCAFVMRLTRP